MTAESFNLRLAFNLCAFEAERTRISNCFRAATLVVGLAVSVLLTVVSVLSAVIGEAYEQSSCFCLASCAHWIFLGLSIAN